MARVSASWRGLLLAGLAMIWVDGRPLNAAVLRCPDTDTVFLDAFETRLPLTGLAAAGPYATASRNGTTVRGDRQIPWSAAYPTAAPGARALLLFAPGFQISSAAYANLINHLASWGFIAVRADPVGTLFNTSHPEMVLDLRAVLDDLLLPSTLPVPIDVRRLAMSGHSLGGKLAVMVAFADSRITAVYAFDPVNSQGGSAGQPNILPQGIAQQAIPFGFAGELLDGSGGFQPCAPLSLNYQTFFNAAASTPAAYEWTVNGAGHTDFVTNPDQCGLACSLCQDGPLDVAVTHAFMRSSAVAFLRTYLLGEPGLCPWLNGGELPAAIQVRVRP